MSLRQSLMFVTVRARKMKAGGGPLSVVVFRQGNTR